MSSSSTFKAMSASYADRIRAGLPATQSPIEMSSASSYSGHNGTTDPNINQGISKFESSSSTTASNSFLSAGQGSSGSSGPPSTGSSHPSPAVSQNGSGGGKGRAGPTAPGRSTGSDVHARERAKGGIGPDGQKGETEGKTESDGEWQEVGSTARPRNPKERYAGKREFGSGHRGERLAGDSGYLTGERSRGQGQQEAERSGRGDRESLGLSRNTEPGWNIASSVPPQRSSQSQARQDPQRPGPDEQLPSSSIPSLATLKPTQLPKPVIDAQPTQLPSEDSSPPSRPIVAASVVPPSPSLGNTLENSSTAASLRSPQPSQSGTEDVHVVGSNGWESPNSTDGETSTIARSTHARIGAKSSIPQVNIWQIRKDRMFTAASALTGVIAAATAQAVSPGASISSGTAMSSDKKGDGQESRNRSEGLKSGKSLEKSGVAAVKGGDKPIIQGDRKGERGRTEALPALSDAKIWPEVQMAAQNAIGKTRPVEKWTNVEETDAMALGAKKEKTKWKAISAAEMQAAIDAVKDQQRSEASKNKRVATMALHAQPDGGSVGESSRPKGKPQQVEKAAKVQDTKAGPLSPTNPVKKTKAASTKGGPANADKSQFAGSAGGNNAQSAEGSNALMGGPLHSNAKVMDHQSSVAQATPPNDQPGPASTRRSSNAGSTRESIPARKDQKLRAMSQASQDRQLHNASNVGRVNGFPVHRGGSLAGPANGVHIPYTQGGAAYAANAFPSRGRGGGRGGRSDRGGRVGAGPNGIRFGNESFTSGVAMSNKPSAASSRGGVSMAHAMHAAPVFEPTYGYPPLGPYDQGHYGYPKLPPAYYQPMGYPNSTFENPYSAPPAVQPPPPLPVTDTVGLDIARIYILGQLEYYFSIQNLAMDFFLRQQMDSQGWIDLAMIASFNRIKNLTTDVKLVAEVARLSSVLEVKLGKVRLADGNFQQWVLPDAAPTTFQEGMASPTQSELVLAATSDLSEGARDRIEKDVTRDVLKSVPGETQHTASADARSSSSSTTVVESKGDISIASSGDADVNEASSEKVNEEKGDVSAIGDEKLISL